MADYWSQADQSGWYSTGGGEQQQQQHQQYAAYTPAAASEPMAGDPYAQYHASADVARPPDPYYGQMFDPAAAGYAQQQQQQQRAGGGSRDYGGEDLDADEVPLLEELGINFDHIKTKTMAVLNPMKTAPAEVIQDQDLAGPLVFCLLFGAALLLHGKVHFGYIYGIGVLGCVGMYYILNLMASGQESCTVTCTVSVLGYCLLPMALLSFATALLSFRGVPGLTVTTLAVVWCAFSAAKLFVTTLSMQHQQWLVAYPCALLYGTFALLAVF